MPPSVRDQMAMTRVGRVHLRANGCVADDGDHPQNSAPDPCPARRRPTPRAAEPSRPAQGNVRPLPAGGTGDATAPPPRSRGPGLLPHPRRPDAPAGSPDVVPPPLPGIAATPPHGLFRRLPGRGLPGPFPVAVGADGDGLRPRRERPGGATRPDAAGATISRAPRMAPDRPGHRRSR